MSVTFTCMWLTALDQGSDVVARPKEDVLIITVINDELSPFMTHTELFYSLS